MDKMTPVIVAGSALPDLPEKEIWHLCLRMEKMLENSIFKADLLDLRQSAASIQALLVKARRCVARLAALKYSAGESRLGYCFSYSSAASFCVVFPAKAPVGLDAEASNCDATGFKFFFERLLDFRCANAAPIVWIKAWTLYEAAIKLGLEARAAANFAIHAANLCKMEDAAQIASTLRFKTFNFHDHILSMVGWKGKPLKIKPVWLAWPAILCNHAHV